MTLQVSKFQMKTKVPQIKVKKETNKNYKIEKQSTKQ